ncbi:MAG: 16S rRNA (cytosine(1402)-N(4))-methyltransferase RsmH [Gemmatimonadaceae bacterium]|nr:16S rRNA (cytosine(1402)-N(4))-methyltransferase RsmH [Gemmatimonadaceae bacterium]
MTRESTYHVPVLLDPVCGLLASSSHVLDCTLGGGGHTAALLERGVPHVTGVDRDPRAIAEARSRLATAEREGRFRAVTANYARLDEGALATDERFGGILLDLGVSSHQFDDPARGFTFREGAPLDMRMGDDADLDAAALLNSIDERDLAAIFRAYGDEPRAARLAREIVRRRATRPFETSDDFVNAIRAVLGARSGPSDFARLFQALRIAVNDELAGLERALPALRDRLEPGGTLAVIAYHSGEDRLVKHAFREWSTPPETAPFVPDRDAPPALGTLVTRRAIVATDDEVARNPRARSAKLRAWRRAA